MTRLTLLATVLLIAASSVFGQNAATMSPYRAMPAPAGITYGNILYPGGPPSTHPMALGATVAGIPYPGVAPPVGRGGHGGRPRTIVVPYAMPVYGGGYYGGYGYEQQQMQPNITVVVPQQPAPSVIINNHYGSDPGRPVTTAETSVDRGGLRVYEPPASSAPAAREPAVAVKPTGSLVREDKPNIYLIALRDGTVRQAIGYWSKSGALHFVTPAASVQQVSLSDVDRDATAKLNADRKLDFDLPFE